MAGSSSNTQPSFFGGGGTDNGGLGVTRTSSLDDLNKINNSKHLEFIANSYIVKDYNSKPTELGMGLFEFVEGGGLLKAAKVVKESALAEKTVVIGEDMVNRVIPFAKEHGFKYFKPRGTNPANWMRNQTQWIYRQIKDPTVRIIDIGSKGVEATSKYYKRELEMIKKYLEIK